jgi:hypothetical protein
MDERRAIKSYVIADSSCTAIRDSSGNDSNLPGADAPRARSPGLPTERPHE